MGAWGKAPWDNDSACEWFEDVMDRSSLPLLVEAALKLDPEEHHEEVRAAAYVLIALGRSYIWPIEKLDEHLTLAIAKLRDIQSMEIYREAADFGAVIVQEIAELESRRKRE